MKIFKKKLVLFVSLTLLSVTVIAQNEELINENTYDKTLLIASYKIPKGWIKRGEAPDRFDMGIAKGEGQNGKNAATVKSIDNKKTGFGTLMQNSKPDQFLGKKIKLIGYLKTKDVTGWAGLWMRVDKANDKFHLDNMGERPLEGTHDWTKCEIIMEVPKNAVNLAFGGLIDGNGQIWFCNLKIETASDSEKVTGTMVEDGVQKRPDAPLVNPMPTNLDFSK